MRIVGLKTSLMSPKILETILEGFLNVVGRTWNITRRTFDVNRRA